MKIQKINNVTTSNHTTKSSSTPKALTFQAEPDKVEISSKKKETNTAVAYTIGGLAIIGAVAYAIKRHRAPKLPEGAKVETEIKTKVVDNIKNTVEEVINPATGESVVKTGEKAAGEVKSGPAAKTSTESKGKDVSAEKLGTKIKEQLKPKKNNKYGNWALSEEEKAKITVNPSKDFKIRLNTGNVNYVESNNINEVIEKIIKSSDSSIKDKNIAREVLPTLIKNDKGLEIGGHYERFLGSIDAENKDFAMSKVVPLLAENYKKMGLSDSYNNNKFMRAVTPENIKYFKPLADVSKELSVGHSQHFRWILGFINNKNEKFIFNESIPTIIKNKEKLLKPGGREVEDLVIMLTPKNIKRVFEEDLPLVLANTKDLKIKYSSSVIEMLEAINKNGKDFVFKEALPLIKNNSEKLKLDDGYNTTKLLKSVTPENKGNLKLIIDNAEKLEVKNSYDAEYLMEKTEQELLDLIKK